MPALKETIDAIVKAGVRSKIKIMVGGAPETGSCRLNRAPTLCSRCSFAADLAKKLAG
jgi:5-methyltetrahydrofolate--homocysteine methyltransferase